MRLVIDANILFAALIARKKTLEVLLHPDIEIAAPDFIKKEWKEHQEEIAKKASLSLSEATAFLIILAEKMHFYSPGDMKKEIKEVKDITDDQDDIEYLALALKLNCPLWSEDKDMKKQSRINVFTTAELLKILSEEKE